MALPLFSQGAFQVDANATPDQIAAKRAYIAAMMPKFGSARYVGEGLGQLASGVVIGRQNKRLNEAEGAGRKSAADQFGRLFGTANSAQGPDVQGPMSVLGMTPQSGPAMPPPDPNSPHALGDAAMAAIGKPAVKTAADPASIKAGLVARGLPDHIAEGFVKNMQDESGLNPGINEAAPLVPGSRGGFGLYQLTGPRRRAFEAFASERGLPLDDVDAQLDFMMMELQGPERAAWEKISGAQNAGEAGAAIVNYFLRPAEEHRASRAAEYLGGQGMPSSPAPTSAPSIPINELYMALQNPWMSAEEKGLITSMIQEQQAASDPMKQIELQKAQLELDQMQNPTQQPPEDFATRMFTLNALQIDPQSEEGKVYLMTGNLPQDAAGGAPAAFTAMDMQAQAAGLVPGTPEYQAFMRNGSGAGTPAAFTALDLQAQAAGFAPGTPEYQEFMATRGAGLAQEAKTRGAAAAAAEIAAPADIASAETTLGYIASLRDHPGRATGSGASSFLGSIPGTNAREFQIEVERLKAGAFLTAIDQLKGMGALSNAEGQTATAAVAALDPGGTEEGFLKRLAEYEELVNRGLERARKRAAPDAPATGGKRTLRWNPTTESFE